MWNRLSPEYESRGGSYIADVMRNIAVDHPALLPKLRSSNRLLVLSDFSGDHPGARFSTLSIILMPMETVGAWNRHRLAVRRRYGVLDRRFGYSKWTDRRKREALEEFCKCASLIPGLSITFIVDARISSLFRPGGRYDPAEVVVDGKTFGEWKQQPLERAMRAAYFVALLISGVSSPGQNATWVTDEDDIAPNPSALSDLGRLFSLFAGQMSPHRLGEFALATTASPKRDDLLVEDLAAIPDLVAGATSELVTSYGGDIPLYDVVAPAPDDLRAKARDLIVWLFAGDRPLKQIMFTIEHIPGTVKHRYGCPAITFQTRLVRQEQRHAG